MSESSTAATPPADQASETSATSRPWLIVSAVLAYGLFFSQLLFPAETAESGGIAILTAGWFLLLMGAGIVWYRFGQLDRLDFDWWDVLVILICVSPSLSGLAILTGEEGNLRLAFYVMTSWWGSAVAVLMLRRINEANGNQLFALMLIGVSLTGSLLGIYQHHVSYQQTSALVAPVVTESQRITQKLDVEELSNYERQKLLRQQQVNQQKLNQMGVPLEPRAQQMFLQRLTASSEPFGFFALANSLGGLLVIGCLLAMGVLYGLMRTDISRPALLMIVFVLIALLYCLLLTKSRTAWGGLLIGGLGLGVSLVVTRAQLSQKAVVAGLGIGVLLLILIGAAFLTGSLDLEVLTEAGKSFRYRMEYWSGTWAMLQDHLVLGAGPGQFRETYLTYKLPQSSEEIADAHNLWLEAWSSGGLLMLVSLAGLVIYSLIHQWRASRRDTSNSWRTDRFWPLFSIAALSLVLSQYFIPPEISQFWLDTLGWGLVLIIGLWGLQLSCGTSRMPAFVGFWAGCGLLIHLQAAGGFGSPVFFQLLALLLVGIRSQKPVVSLNSRSGPVILLVIGLAGLLGTWQLAVMPRLAESAAMAQLPEAENRQELRRILERWIEDDSTAPQPWRILADAQLQAGISQKNGIMLQKALESAAEFRLRDPRTYAAPLLQGEIFEAMYGLDQEVIHLDVALEFYQEAISRYPTEADLYVNLARVLSASDRMEAAAEAARQAISLNGINSEYGHTDRLLSPQELENLQKTLSSPVENTNE